MKFLFVLFAIVAATNAYSCPNPIFPSYPCQQQQTDCGRSCSSGSGCSQDCNTYPSYPTYPSYSGGLNGVAYQGQPDVRHGGNAFMGAGYSGLNYPEGYSHTFSAGQPMQTYGSFPTSNEFQHKSYSNNIFPAQMYPSVMPNNNFQQESFYPGYSGYMNQFQGGSALNSHSSNPNSKPTIQLQK